MILFEKLFTKNSNTNPLINPVRFQFSEHYTNPILGNKGKVYLKRGKMNDGVFYKDEEYYAVPSVWECPIGFIHDGYAFWKTNSEIHAINQYRFSKNAQNKLKKKWDKEIEKHDYLYSLSSAIDLDIELPKLPNDFIIRPHQKVGIEFGNLTNGKFIIADQQRTGKSFTSLIYALSCSWDKCLIVCPSKVVIIWESMINKISDIPVKILKSGDTIELGFNIISYDLIHKIDNKNVDICIADECHFFIQDNARRSAAMQSIIANKKIALSGTPLLNSHSDMLSITKWLDSDLEKEIRRFLFPLNGNNYDIAKLLGIELRRRCLLLRETSQVGTVNEPYINFIEIDLQIDNPKDIKEVGKAKVDYAVEYINSFDNKILVAFYHKEVGKMLKARLGNKAILIDGDSTKLEIENAKEEFKNEKQILLGSTVIAEGLDFSFCDHILMVEESSYSMRTDQIRERCNNIYKNRNVIIDILCLKGTQDDRLYELLGNKFALQEGLRDS